MNPEVLHLKQNLWIMNNMMPWPLEWHRFAKLKLVVRVHPVSLTVIIDRKYK